MALSHLFAAYLAMTQRIDGLHLELPFTGGWRLRDLPRQERVEFGCQHVATLLKKMAIEAICRRPNMTKPARNYLGFQCI